MEQMLRRRSQTPGSQQLGPGHDWKKLVDEGFHQLLTIRIRLMLTRQATGADEQTEAVVATL